MTADPSTGRTEFPTVRVERSEVANSSGTEPPRIPLPDGATDCHHHIFDPRFPKEGSPARTVATTDDYARLKRRLGLSRSVVVAPATYRYDNTCLLDALRTFGDAARGVALLNADTPDREIENLHARGVRGVRIYLEKFDPPTPVQLMALARRIVALGWHIEVMPTRGQKIVDCESVLAELPCDIVIDHLGYTPQPDGIHHPAFAAMCRLLRLGKTWIKLSGVYFTSKEGYPNYADVDEIARHLVKEAPQRMLWGSDWPHSGEKKARPDDALLIDRLACWAPDPEDRHTILVENPQRLYWYA